MKYEIGDKVLIRSDLSSGKNYDGIYFAHEMLDYKGKELTITAKTSAYYNVKENYWCWTDGMIEKKIEDEEGGTYIKILNTKTPHYFEEGAVYVHKDNKINVKDDIVLYGNLEYILDLMKHHCETVITSKEEYAEKNSQKVIETAAEKLSKQFIDYYEAEKNRLRDKWYEKERNYKDLKIKIQNTYYDFILAKKQYHAIDKPEYYKENILKELIKINDSKYCESIEIENSSVVIKTIHLYMTEPYTNRRYSLGKMKFVIPFDKEQNITIFNLTDTKTAYSSNMQHPHIFSLGDACWGNADMQLAFYRTEDEYYALYQTILNFCQTADIDDCAGWYLSCWDEVDKNGNVINDGHAPEDEDEYEGYGCKVWDGDAGGGETEGLHYCVNCGEACYEGDDAYYCNDCGNWFCSNCADYIDELGVDLCNRCIEENYTNCEDCGCLVRNEDTYESEIGSICISCKDSYYISCEGCGTYVHKSNLYKLEGDSYCKDCYNSIKEEMQDEEEGSVA